MYLARPERGYSQGGVPWIGHTDELDISNLTATGNPCIGLITHQNQQRQEGYGLFLCRNGAWEIYRFDDQGRKDGIQSGQLRSGKAFHLKFVTNAGTQGLAVNHGDLNSIIDKTFANTDFISLALFGSDGGSVIFSNFTYTPAA